MPAACGHFEVATGEEERLTRERGTETADGKEKRERKEREKRAVSCVTRRAAGANESGNLIPTVRENRCTR